MVYFRPLPLLLVVVSLALCVDAQISALFGNAVRAENCATWTGWGPCIWLKGANPRWNRTYFEQLLPGRTGCRQHVFFRLLKDRWGEAFSNFFEYIRSITLDDRPCGQCSYQQSCGRKCHRRGTSTKVNPLFVAERRCETIEQNRACTSTWMDNCRVWPNAAVPLPNVTASMLDVINNIDFIRCIPDARSRNCRCCCSPYRPNPTTFECELR